MLKLLKYRKNLLYLKQQAWHNSSRALKLLSWHVKKQKAQKCVQTLQSSQGSTLYKTQYILKEFEQFYSSLYSLHKPNDTKMGFIPRRTMMDNIRKTLNVIRHCKTQKITSVILSLDFEKAFDSVEYNYIIWLLQHMNFGPKFLTAMRAIYDQPRATIKLNNARSDFIPIIRGTCQSCPLSPLLFALCIEPLANMIRIHKDIDGIQIAQKEIKTSLFADYVILYLSNPKKSLRHVEAILNIFREASGLAINKTKSEVYPIFFHQCDHHELRSLTSYSWITLAWKYLGINFPLDIANIYKENFVKTYKSILTSLTSLTQQTFSWIDRLHIVKSFIMSRFIFLTRMLPIDIPVTDLRKWQAMLNKFIWSYKRQCILHKIMRLPCNRGGVGVPDIQLYFEAVQLANVLRMLNTMAIPDWMDIELHLLDSTASEIFWSPKQKWPLHVKDNPYSSTTLRIWDKWKTRLTGDSYLLMPLSICLKLPKELKLIIDIWKHSNIHTIWDITKKR